MSDASIKNIQFKFMMLKIAVWIIFYVAATHSAQLSQITNYTVPHPVKYERITNYTQYLKKWEEIVTPQDIHGVSQQGDMNQICYGQKCQFFYYQYNAPRNQFSPLSDRTVLLVSGMHGNQYLGPHVLLYGYKHFKAAKIIYFPMANPSGFIKQQRLTFPTNKDPNRDFPIDSNIQCYQVYSTFVLDALYRKHKIDLTIVLHNGQSNIAFNWGTNFHRQKSHSEDYDIQIAIAQMMQRAGGSNTQLKMTPFKIGTMNEVVYPATGTFDDWAYAAGKFPQFITQCRNIGFVPYPEKMANGLLFLIELGPFQNDLFGSEEAVSKKNFQEISTDGYISRGIRTIKSALQIVSPTLQILWMEDKASIIARGCSTGTINKLQIFEVVNNTYLQNIFSLKQTLKIQGNVRKESPKSTFIQYENTSKLSNNSKVYFKGEFVCSEDWIGKGTTFFAQRRVYRFASNQTAALVDSKLKTKAQNLVQWLLQWLQKNSKIRDIIIYTIIGFIAFCILSLIFSCIRCICSPYHIKREEKFQEMTPQEEQAAASSGGDLHTARGGIIGDAL